ncbi:MAG: alpha-amylase family glycosyl hydrolase, partial [Paraglaciecola chathamensis]
MMKQKLLARPSLSCFTFTAITMALTLALTACTHTSHTASVDSAEQSAAQYYGTDNPFVKEAVYFVMTDRFVDGDESN